MKEPRRSYGYLPILCRFAAKIGTLTYKLYYTCKLFTKPEYKYLSDRNSALTRTNKVSLLQKITRSILFEGLIRGTMIEAILILQIIILAVDGQSPYAE